MASGREVHVSDLPPELGTVSPEPQTSEQSEWPDAIVQLGPQRAGTRQTKNPAGRGARV